MKRVINVGFKEISPIFWRRLFAAVQPIRTNMEAALAEAERIALENESAIAYQTGSICYASMVALFALAFFYRPKVIVEVGTYTFRSGMSLLHGSLAGSGGGPSRLFTCDMNVAETRFGRFADQVTFFDKQDSTRMFAALCEDNVQADLLFLDGLLQRDDFQYLPKLLKPETIFAFDDFEGNEKGVYNSDLLNNFLGGKLYSIYPPGEGELSTLGIIGQSVLGLGLSPDSIQLTRQ